MRVLTVEEMRRVEAAADASGHTYAAMMELAGRAVADAVMQLLDIRGRRILVLVGPGNNGGDGLVAARQLSEGGAEVFCYLLKPRSEDDVHYQGVCSLGLFVADATDDGGWRVLRRLASNADVIVDALLGTGVRLPLKGAVSSLLEQVARALQTRRSQTESTRGLTWLREPVAARYPLIVAVDGPSGLNYDDGVLDSKAMQADVTVTFGFPKFGHLLRSGAAACGDLAVADIGVTPALVQEELGDVGVEMASPAMIRSMLPERPRDAHKGTFGRALLVAGSINYTGAASLAAGGAARVGTGLVTLAIPQAIHTALATQISEATYLILPEAMGIVARDAVRPLMRNLAGFDAMLLGSGLTQEKESVEFIHELLKAGHQPRRKGRIGFQSRDFPNGDALGDEPSPIPPLVVDADGLNALTRFNDGDWWRVLPSSCILTPHPGEMARLMGISVEDVQDDRIKTAIRMASKWQHVIVLKGAYTVVASPDGRTVVLPFATPALASAGSGDVLAGAVVGLLAQGLAPFEAALAGAFLHGLAGSLAGREIGSAGVVASDLLPRLPRALSSISWRT